MTAMTKAKPQRAGAGYCRHAANATATACRRGRVRTRPAATSETSAKVKSGSRTKPTNQSPTAHQATDPAQATAASSTGSARVHSSRRTRARPGSTYASTARGTPIAEGSTVMVAVQSPASAPGLSVARLHAHVFGHAVAFCLHLFGEVGRGCVPKGPACEGALLAPG